MNLHSARGCFTTPLAATVVPFSVDNFKNFSGFSENCNNSSSPYSSAFISFQKSLQNRYKHSAFQNVSSLCISDLFRRSSFYSLQTLSRGTFDISKTYTLPSFTTSKASTLELHQNGATPDNAVSSDNPFWPSFSNAMEKVHTQTLRFRAILHSKIPLMSVPAYAVVERSLNYRKIDDYLDAKTKKSIEELKCEILQLGGENLSPTLIPANKKATSSNDVHSSVTNTTSTPAEDEEGVFPYAYPQNASVRVFNSKRKPWWNILLAGFCLFGFLIVWTISAFFPSYIFYWFYFQLKDIRAYWNSIDAANDPPNLVAYFSAIKESISDLILYSIQVPTVTIQFNEISLSQMLNHVIRNTKKLKNRVQLITNLIDWKSHCVLLYLSSILMMNIYDSFTSFLQLPVYVKMVDDPNLSYVRRLRLFMFRSLLDWFREGSAVIFEDYRAFIMCGRSTKKPTLLCYHPHGILSLGIHSLLTLPEFENYRIMGAPVLKYFCPLLRQGYVKLGSADRTSFINAMKNNESLILVPGGVHEATITDYGKEKLYMKQRKGFIRYSLQHGYSITPTYSFGENLFYEQKSSNFVNDFKFYLNTKGIPTVLPFGSLWSPLGILPYRVPVLVVVGPPLDLPIIEHPTKLDIDHWHDRYIQELKRIYCTYADSYYLYCKDQFQIQKPVVTEEDQKRAVAFPKFAPPLQMWDLMAKIRVVGGPHLPFRRPLENISTQYLYVNGIGFEEEKLIQKWINELAGILKIDINEVVFVIHRPFCYFDCATIENSIKLKNYIVNQNLELSQKSTILGQQEDDDQLIQQVKRVEFTLKCEWTDVPSPDKFISSTDFLHATDLQIIPRLLVKQYGGESLDSVTSRLQRLNWKKALNKREFLLGKRTHSDHGDFKKATLALNLESWFSSNLLECIKEEWNSSPNEASIIQCVPKQNMTLYVESQEVFEECIAFVSLSNFTYLWFWDIQTKTKLGIRLEGGHILILKGSDRFRCPYSIKSDINKSFLVVFKRRKDTDSKCSPDQSMSLFGIPKIAREQPSDKSCPKVNFDDFSIESDHRFENEYVHQIYDRIATHFSHTRYRPWPQVDHFLKSLPSGSILLDTGCGNGKYSNCNQTIVWIGTDRSLPLLQCALQHGVDQESRSKKKSRLQLFVSDCSKINCRSSSMDACLSIAVIHHLPTQKKRLSAIDEMLRCIKPGGQLLIYVWAWEQEEGTVGSRQFKDQDIFVPWHLQRQLDHMNDPKECSIVSNGPNSSVLNSSDPKNPNLITLFRYYHVFKKQEIQDLCEMSKNGKITEIRYDSNNWVILMTKNF